MNDNPPGLLDTNSVILLPYLRDGTLPARPAVSTITLAELHVGPVVATTVTARRRREADLRAALQLPVLPFDSNAAQAFGNVAGSLRNSGRKRTSRTADAFIAAVALAHGLPLYTCDPADFAGIEGLEVVAVPHPDRN